MSQRAFKPIIARVVRAWIVPPRLKFVLVEDVEQKYWIVQSTPVGTHFWTLAQAAQLAQGVRTHRVLEEAVRLGRRLEQAMVSKQVIALPRSVGRLSRVEVSNVAEDTGAPPFSRRGNPVRIEHFRGSSKMTRSERQTLAGV